jgi:hypothetical protein
VSRFDGTGTVRTPLTRGLRWLDVGTSAAWHVTQWLDSRDPLTGLEVPVPITRSLFDLGVDVGGPKLERVFKTPNNKFAEIFRHVIEPGVNVGTSPHSRRKPGHPDGPSRSARRRNDDAEAMDW